MKLVHATLRPARVIEVLGQGKIRVDAPGKFSEDDKGSLPPVWPFFGQHANSYSSVKEGDEVWLLACSDNKRQLHWIRKDNFEEADAGWMEGENVEIFMNREQATGWAVLMFSDGTGWVMRNGEASINIQNDGKITLDPGIPNRALEISVDGISLGSRGQSRHKAARGDEVQDCLSAIAATLKSLKVAASKSAYTKHLVPAINSQLKGLNKKISQVTSENVSID